MPVDPSPNPIQRFTDLWLANQDMLTGYVYMRVRDFHDAEDVVQEIARSAAGTFEQYDAEQPFGPWLITIANRRIIDYFRRLGRSPNLLSDGALQHVADAHIELADSKDARYDALQACLAKLSDRHRRAIDLRYGQSLAPEQIAKRVGVSPTAVNALIYRVRKALASCINERLGRRAR